MKSEKEKMCAGELYNALDPILTKDRNRARLLIKEYNNALGGSREEQVKILTQLVSHAGKELWIQPPFYCDYGYNIFAGDHVFFNYNCVVLDVMAVTIGSRTMMGPNVQIYTATHPMNYKERSSGLEFAKAITIGSDVWIGGSAVICPGVTIGDRSIIGAGSVVTKDIPPDVFAAGNPCKVIKTIDQ